jgi:ribonuclease R
MAKRQTRKDLKKEPGLTPGGIDPHADREADRYENPIPSREFLLDFLSNYHSPVSYRRLGKDLCMEDTQIEALRRRLRAMERDGQLVANRRGAISVTRTSTLIRGRVLGHRDGFGFVIPQDGSDDLYLHHRQMCKVFDGDEVLVQVAGVDHRGRKEATITEILQRNTHQLVGRYDQRDGFGVVLIDNPRICHDILISTENVHQAQHGQLVVVDIITQPDRHKQPCGRIIEVLGDHMAPGMEIDVAIRSHEIPYIWPEQVLNEARALKPEPNEADKSCRVDLRKLPLVTIDGEDARDFDDAVYCERKRSGGWKLWVAIADVSHYVPLHSALDEEAHKRGTSVYFPERVVPMLPEQLSNGLCSLKPQVDRLCLVCEMSISSKGKISRYKFYDAVMHSHARLTYTTVAQILAEKDQPESSIRKQHNTLTSHLDELSNLYKALRMARQERGAIDFETIETKIVFGPERKIEDIIPVQRNDAHRLIEECMLCANVAAARFLEKHQIEGLYRVHDAPSGQKLANLRQFLGELALELSGGDKPTPQDYQHLLEQVAERPDRQLIQTMMLRSMTQASYQPENRGHFGLDYPAYAHFTSPIRRYPDLLMHRAIRMLIRSKQESNHVQRVPGAKPIAKKAIYPYQLKDLLALGEHCSLTERRAEDASRDVIAWLKCEYLQDRVGETFAGVITAVTGFGLFVELQDLYVEGLVHVSSLRNDFYQYDAATQRLVGEHSRKCYRLGDALQVQVSRVDLDERKIDLQLLDSDCEKGKSGKKGKKGGKPAKGKIASKKSREAGKSRKKILRKPY